MILEHIVAQHAENAAFLWHLRDLAAERPHYTLKDLRRLDERVEANIDGLRIANNGGWEIAKAALSGGQAGEFFVATLLAVERSDLRGIAYILNASEGEPKRSRGIASALGWAPLAAVERIIPGLLHSSCPPSLQWLGIAGCAINRVDPGESLRRAFEAEDIRLRCRAVAATGELGRLDLRNQVERELAAENTELRFHAGVSAALLGNRRAADVLSELAHHERDWSVRSLAMAVRCIGPRIAGQWIESIASRSGGVRPAIVAVGALGDPVHVPWLIQMMEDETVARVAGEAYTSILGVDLKEAGLDENAPVDCEAHPEDDHNDDDVDLDPDEDLPWPNIASIREHWRAKLDAYHCGQRYFMGRPISAEWLREILHKGGQRQRAAAAVELSLHSPGRPVFAVKAPGFRQEVMSA